MEYHTERINTGRKRATDEIAVFLMENFGLRYGYDADTTLAVRDGDKLIATASRTRGVFKYFGILPEYTGLNISGKLIDDLMEDAFSKGIYHYFIFTSPDKKSLFEGSGFKEVFTNQYASLLEKGSTDIHKYTENLKVIVGEGKDRGAIVMNLNPMTLGHLYLIEEARKQCSELIIFVVEEDESVFPFADRIAIIRQHLMKYPNVKVLSGGEYIISKATFPTYFLKKVDDDITAYTSLDAGIFLKYFVPALGITKRFLGEEPLDKMTYLYNGTLKEVLEEGGLEVKIIKRLEKDGKIVSASRVRQYLRDGNYYEAFKLLPEATREFLKTPEGERIIRKIQEE